MRGLTSSVRYLRSCVQEMIPAPGVIASTLPWVTAAVAFEFYVSILVSRRTRQTIIASVVFAVFSLLPSVLLTGEPTAASEVKHHRSTPIEPVWLRLGVVVLQLFVLHSPFFLSTPTPPPPPPPALPSSDKPSAQAVPDDERWFGLTTRFAVCVIGPSFLTHVLTAQHTQYAQYPMFVMETCVLLLCWIISYGMRCVLEPDVLVSQARHMFIAEWVLARPLFLVPIAFGIRIINDYTNPVFGYVTETVPSEWWYSFWTGCGIGYGFLLLPPASIRLTFSILKRQAAANKKFDHYLSDDVLHDRRTMEQSKSVVRSSAAHALTDVCLFVVCGFCAVCSGFHIISSPSHRHFHNLSLHTTI